MNNTCSRVARSARLVAYSSLAGGVMPGAASGEVVSKFAPEVATPGSAVPINLGPGFGEVFRASVYTFSDVFTGQQNIGSGQSVFYQTSVGIQSHVVQFNIGNSGGWLAASIIGYAPAGDANDPRLLGLGFEVGPAGQWAGMSTFGFGSHDLAASSSRAGVSSFFTSGSSAFVGSTPWSSNTTVGDFARTERGYIGLRFTRNAVDFHYAWLDVEANLDTRELTVHGWCFETEPNVGVVTPAPGPAGLGLLAMGAAGIRRSRRREGR